MATLTISDAARVTGVSRVRRGSLLPRYGCCLAWTGAWPLPAWGCCAMGSCSVWGAGGM
jgi:hypothetical protein